VRRRKLLWVLVVANGMRSCDTGTLAGTGRDAGLPSAARLAGAGTARDTRHRRLAPMREFGRA
jgi:hypothetical protein